MNIKRNVPIVSTDKFDDVKNFYLKNFGFKVVFEMEGFLSISKGDKEGFEISFMKPMEDKCQLFEGKWLTYCFEVEDVDLEFEKFKNRTIEIVTPLTDNPWGDRSFIISDPISITIYIYKLIPPTEEFSKYFK